MTGWAGKGAGNGTRYLDTSSSLAGLEQGTVGRMISTGRVIRELSDVRATF